MTRDHRRLAAIVSLDVAGYSRLMGLDDSGTLAALREALQSVGIDWRALRRDALQRERVQA